MFYYKIHESHAGYLLAACDKDVCGKTLKSKDMEFFVNPRFYRDKSATKAGMKKIFRVASAANLVGKDIINLAIELNAVDKDSIIKIQGVPHAQIVVVSV
jgi:uncharacterized protein